MKSNPLSTRFVEPGRIAWLAPDPSQTLETLTDRFFNKLNCRAAIVGPHGSGKSTLLAHLVRMIGVVVCKRDTYTAPDSNLGGWQQTIVQPADGQQRKIVWLQMRGQAASAKLLQETQADWQQRQTVLVVDGFEQLSLFARTRVGWITRTRGVGLLVTSHRRTSLPTLIETSVSEQLARELLQKVLPADVPNRAKYLNTDYLQQMLKRHQGNLREVFMQMYDEIEN